ncbi:MAG: hypothetical protein HOP34_10675 [Methylococcaceae bacterium]|nr:hypothetical protein [Methylococcaceae bacterium]
MDEKQLTSELEGFKQACIKMGAIGEDNSENKIPTFVFDEVYQGVFLVNVSVKDEWLDKKYEASALNELIELLYKTTTPHIRESILTLRLCKTSFPYDTIQYDTLADGKTA